MNVTLDEIIEKDRKERQQQGRKGGSRGNGKGSRKGGSGGGNGDAGVKARQPDGDGPPSASAAELKEMEAFGRMKRSRAQEDGGGSKWGASWRSQGPVRSARSEPYRGGAWAKSSGWDKGGDGGKGGKSRGWEREWAWDDTWDAWPAEADSRGPKSVLVGNLDCGVMPTDLEEMFEPFGVQKTWVDYDSTDRSTGTGGATFSSPSGALAACQRFHGAMVDGQKVYVELDHGSGSGKGKGRKGYDGKWGSKGKGKTKGNSWDW